MKNKILAMLLVVASLVLTLTGCAYNYEKKDLSKYADFDYETFLAALQAVHVEDGEFALGKKDVRDAKVAEELYNRIVKELDSEDRLITGTVGSEDVLYYCYYLEATFEEGEGEDKKDVKYYFYAANMKVASLTALALKYDLDDEVDQMIKEKILAFDGENAFVLDGKVYDPIVRPEQPETAPAGMLAYVSYTKKVEGKDNESVTKKLITLADAEGVDSLAAFLVGKKVGEKLEVTVEPEVEGGEATKQNLTYTDADGAIYDDIKIESIEQAAPATGLAFVTYTFTAATGGASKQYTNQLVTLTDAAEGSFAAWLAGKEIGNQLKDGSSTLTFTDEVTEGAKGSYDKITINWVVNAEATEFTVTPKENPFKEVTSNVTATDGTKKTLKDAKADSLVYHVYPVGRQEVPELTAETAKMIVTDLFGDTIVADALDCFTKDSGWEYTKKEEGKDDVVRTLYTIIEELVKAYDELEKAEDELSKNTDSTKKEELQKKVEEAEAKVNEEALDKVWQEILLCTKEGVDETIAEVMVEEYNDLVYKTLEDAYNEEILKKVVTALWELIDESVKVNEVPKKALKNAYKHNINAYKYDFYTGTVDGTSSGTTNKKQYETVRNYLIAVAQDVATELGVSAPADGDYKAACAVLEKEAEQQVIQQIKVWVVLQAMDEKTEDLDLSVSDSEIDSFAYMQALLSYYYYGVSISEDMVLEGYGKENIRTALAFDKLMDYLTETQAEEKDADGKVTTEADASKFLHINVLRDEPKDEEAEQE